MLSFFVRQDGDIRQSDVRHQMTCSVFSVRRERAWSCEPGAWSLKSVSLRDDFYKNAAGGCHRIFIKIVAARRHLQLLIAHCSLLLISNAAKAKQEAARPLFPLPYQQKIFHLKRSKREAEKSHAPILCTVHCVLCTAFPRRRRRK